jgi:hypothetical protein
MISREDFVFTIGFDGLHAVVDGRAKRQYGKLSTMELAETGLYRAAFSSALFSKDETEMRSFIDFFNKLAGTSYTRPEDFKRLFGVEFEEVTKVLVL